MVGEANGDRVVKKLLLALFILVASGATPCFAGGRPSMYVVVDRVETTQNESSISMIRIWGSFTRVKPKTRWNAADQCGRDDYYKPINGYIQFGLGSDKEAPKWKKAVGTGKAVPVGCCGGAGAFDTVVIHPADEKPKDDREIVPYPTGHLEIYGYPTHDLFGSGQFDDLPGVKTLLAFAAAKQKSPALISADDFNNCYGGIGNAVQWQSGQNVAHSGGVTGWTEAGEHSMHAVDRANRAGQSNPPNWAVMIFQDNVITSDAFAANASGQVYRIDFEASPAVYANPQQATQAGDELLIEVLRGDDRVLASHKHSPGAWTGTLKFAPGSFRYTGDGSGDVRLRIKPAGPQTSGRFHGAIDNIIVTKVEAKK
jgi:hypothetical protein